MRFVLLGFIAPLVFGSGSANVDFTFGTPTNLGSVVNSSAYDEVPSISADGLTLYFNSNRPNGHGAFDLWMTTRSTRENPWGPPENLGTVINSISDNHGILHGEPFWQPHSGKKRGALEFDGINDYVETGYTLNPAENSFSTFAWIKGGSPEQVILSQTDGPGGAGEIWLGADAVEGKLMTTLRSPSGRSPAPPMVADVVITNGQWHHVGIVVTEQKVRHLYVDGIRAAFDTQPVLLPFSGGVLHIGTGKNLGAETFFSGLIDDVRIYNVALTPEQIETLAH